MLGNVKLDNKPRSQFFPLNPSLHAQRYPLKVSMHAPPFLHGEAPQEDVPKRLHTY